MEKRRKNPAGSIPDLEFASTETNSDDNGKGSRTFYCRVFAGLSILISLVFFSSSAARPLRQQYGILPGVISQVHDIKLTKGLSIQDLKQVPLPKEELNLVSMEMLPLTKRCQQLIEDVRSLKSTGVVMESDERAQTMIALLQSNLKALFKMRFADGPILVKMSLEFPSSMITEKYPESTGEIMIEMAPVEYVPYSVYFFLELVHNFESGAFHRNAGHVLQSMITLKHKNDNKRLTNRGLAFQEYDPRVPHQELTLGYAGRPGGPPFYISTMDNTENHGPGSQGSESEADSCFGKIVSGMEVSKRMMSQPGGVPPNGFISNPADHIKILSLRLMTPDAMHDADTATL